MFHSVLGRRSVEEDAAERFRSCGFEVALPDLYAGKRADSLDEGFQLMAEIGWPVICGRAFEATRNLPDSTILAGFSMGAGVITSLWGRRPQTKAVLLFHGLSDIPSDARSGLKVQTHIADVDRLVPAEQKTLWAASARTAGLLPEIHGYPDTGHFFTDFNSTDYCAAASQVTWSRALAFLERL
jgi:dienelactone hydrolase